MLERQTRNTVFRRALPAADGGASMFVSGSAGLKYLFKPLNSVDPVLCSLAHEFVRIGDVVWDVGANVGLFSFVAAHLAGQTGQVVAFEPDTWLIQLLRRSAAIQPATSAPVQILPVAVAADCDVKTFNVAARSRALNSLAGYPQRATQPIAEQQSVMSVSLDWTAARLRPPDILKIDVEGAESEVLNGCQRLLEKDKPIVLCEVCESSSPQVTQLLKRFEYRIFNGELPLSQRAELNAAPWNTVAIPRNRRR